MYTVFAFAPLFGELQRRGWFPLWLALALGVLAVVIVGVLYVKEAGRIGALPRAVMALVRTAVVLLIAFLLMRPVWVSKKETTKTRPVAVLIDVSQSMASPDPRPNNDDQARAAIAFGLLDADKGLPDQPVASLVDRLPERPKRVEVARAALLNPKVDFLKRLSAVGPLEVYTFGSQRTGRDAAKDDWLTNLQATEPKTALVESAFELLNRDDTDAPAAIVIVTDGRENTGPKSLDDLARECARRNIPIHIYGVGSSAYAQLQAAFGAASGDKAATSRAGADVDVPNTLFVDDITSIPVRYTVKGVAEGTANVVVRYGDREVATRQEKFTLTPEEMRAGKTLSTVVKFTPTKADADSKKQEYSATVTVTSGGGAGAETLVSSVSRPAQVVNRKLKLLWVDGLPRFDFQFMQRWLLRDRRVDAKFYLTEGDRSAMRSGDPWMVGFSRELNGVLAMERDEFRKVLFDFDVLVLGDVPAKFFTKEHQELIKEFVTEGGGLIHIAGRWNAPAGWASPKAAPNAKADPNPIAEILPVEFETVRFPIQALENPVGFVPVLAPGAARTHIVNLEDDPIDNAEKWGRPGPPPANPPEKQLKPLYWYYPVTRVKPAADVFLTHPTARTPAPDNKPMPLLVGHYYGKGYALFMGFDDTWRWRFNTQDKLGGKFYTQAVYTAGIPRIVGTKQTQISSNTPAPVEGGTGEVYVRVFNENYQPFTADEIEGTLENLGADVNAADRTATVKFRRVADGEYVTTLPYNKVGNFRLTVDPKNKSPAALNYAVNYREDHELAPGAMDEPAMRKLARDSRGGADGGFYREETLHTLPAEVTAKTSPLVSREETLLWNEWAMALLIGLLTVEWFLRKFNGLS